MGPRWVKKRDGRIEPFDEARIAQAVIRAGRHAVKSEEVERLGRELARAVALFLAREPGPIPDTARIATALEQALDETGHASIARAARDWRDWRQRRRGEVRVREATPQGEGPALEVLSPGAARPWTKQRVVQALVQQAGLEHETAEDVARAVEERVFAAGLNQISTTLLRELIDAELFERGFSAQLGRLETYGVPKPDLERLAFLAQGRPAVGLEEQVLRGALERWALEELVGAQGAAAHRRGDVHLLGLGRPYRLASGAVDAGRLLASVRAGAGEPARAPTVLEAVGAWVRAGRAASLTHDLAFGLVGVEAELGAQLTREGEPPVRAALELLFEALAAPLAEDGPAPSPELLLVVDLGGSQDPGEPSRRRAIELLLESLRGRGARAAGLRLVGRLRDPGPAPGLLPALLEAAHAGAPCDLEVGPGEGLWSRGTAPGAAAGQVAQVNLAGLALAAGRGERQRFSLRLEQALEAALEAFHQRRRRVATWPACPALPLFHGGRDPALVPLEPERQADAVGLVGLDAALRYLTGEGPTENPRVAELACEVALEARERTAHIAARLGLGRVRLEDAPDGDAGVRAAALDLDRWPDARELLGGAAGWDTGVSSLASGAEGELRLRLQIARRLGGSVWLRREVLASEAPGPVADQVLEALAQRGTGRHGRRPGSGRPGGAAERAT